MRAIRWTALFLLLAAVHPAHGDAKDAIQTFKSDFQSGRLYATRVAALGELVSVADPKVLEAFEWARDYSSNEILRRIIERDDALKALAPIEEQLAELARAAAERARRAGQPPPKTFPVPPSLAMKHDQLRNRVEGLQREIDTEYELRNRAAQTLGEWLNAAPRDLLGEALEDLERGALRSPDWAVRRFHARALGHATDPGASRLLLLRLEAERDRRVLPVVIDAIARHSGDLAVRHLLPFLTDARWQIRAATIAALGRIGSKDAIEPLIERLRAEEGRLRGDVAAALKAITGQDLGIIPERWEKWWEANRKAFEPGGKGDGEAGPEGSDTPVPQGVPSFYGIRIVSKRILFVIDLSGSMSDPAGKDRTKLDVAKYELRNAILGLPEDAVFNIVPYAEDVSIWRKGMVKARGKDKRAAVKFIDDMEAVGATNIYEALERAFHLVGTGARDKNYEDGADTIFFLSDGQPTRGKILEPTRILEVVRRWNATRRVKIHTVGVGSEHDRAFMKALAESSGGTYVSR